jgi:hypothetical protein
VDDDRYLLFVIFTCIVTLAVPSAAQALVATFACALVVAARLCTGDPDRPGTAERDRHDVSG